MNTIRSAEKNLERIRSSGSFPTLDHRPPAVARRGGWGVSGIAEDDDGPVQTLRRERSRTAEITLDDSDDDDPRVGKPGSKAVGKVAEDKLRELNAAGIAALQKRDNVRAKQFLEDAITAVKRGDIADVGLVAATYGNYGAMLLAGTKNSDKAVEVLADAVVRITRVPPEVQSLDLEKSLQNIQSVLTFALENGTGEDIRLEVIFQYSTGARLERERKGFECLEHLRIAHDLSKTCMGAAHPAHKAISGAFDRAKKMYAAGATTFQSKKAQADVKKGKKGETDVCGDDDESDFLSGASSGLRLFEKGLSSDVWLALKDGDTDKSKAKRVNAGTAAKASLADRNLHSREGSRGVSRDSTRQPSPDIFASAAKNKKKSFLDNLLSGDADKRSGSKMPSISAKPGSQQKLPPSSSSKQSGANSHIKSSKSRHPMDPIEQPNFSDDEDIYEGFNARGQSKCSAPTKQAAPKQDGRGGLKELNVPVPGAKNVGDSRLKTPSRVSSSSGHKSGDRKAASAASNASTAAASNASTAAGKESQQRSPIASQIDDEDESVSGRHLSVDDKHFSSAANSIDDMIGDLSLDKSSHSSKQTSPTAQQVVEESDDDDDAPQFVTVAKHDKELEQQKHVAAGEEAATLARGKLEVADLTAAREALIAAGKEWLAAGVDKTSILAALAGKLAMELARERIEAGDLTGAKDSLAAAAVEWKKAGENRAGELSAVEEAISAAAVKLGRVEEAADMYKRALEVAEEAGDVQAQTAAYEKLGNAYKLLGRNDEAIKVLEKGLALAKEKDDATGQVAAYLALGDAYKALGRCEEAVSMFTKSMELAEQNWNTAGQGKAQRGLGDALAALGRHDEAVKMYSKARELSERTGDVSGIQAALRGLGNAFTVLGKHEEAVAAFTKAMEFAESSGDLEMLSAALRAVGSALTALGKHAEIEDGEMTRATLQNYDKAIEMHSKALELAEQMSNMLNIDLQRDSCSGLANAYDATGRHDEAAEMFVKAREISEKMGDELGQIKALSGLGNAYRSLGNFNEALESHSKSLKIAEKVGDASLEAASYMGLANAYKSLGRYAEALEMLAKAKKIAKESGIELSLAHMKEWTDCATASLLIQCNFRMHLARTEMLAAMKGEYSKTIVVVQAAVRRALVRGRYATQLKRKRAILKIECTTLIQSKFRRAIANHRWVKTIEGLLVMCARLRVLRENSHRARSNAAVVLQAIERARLQCREGAKMMESGRKDRLSCVLQASCRRYQPRMTHRETMATLILQVQVLKSCYSKTTGNCLWINTSSCERCKQVEILKSQFDCDDEYERCLGTDVYARAAVCRRKHAQTVGAILLAACMHALVHRSKWRTIDGAALRKTPDEMDALDKKMEQERCSAIVCIQASIRRLLQRRSGEEKMLDAKRVDSITLIQAVCCRQRARHQHARLLAAHSLQATIRATLARKKHQEGNCGTLLAAVCRRLGPRKVYRKALASRTIQAAMRRRLVEMKRKREETACNNLAHVVKASSARRTYAGRRAASITLQAAFQRNLGQNRGVSQMEERHQELSCQCLQASCRSLIARELYKKGLAARTIQAAVRRHPAAQGIRSSHLACASLERVFRAQPPRRKWSLQQLAARKLQAVLRRRQQQDEGHTHMDETRKTFSMQSLQAVCRRTLARQSYRKDLGARTLQAAGRNAQK